MLTLTKLMNEASSSTNTSSRPEVCGARLSWNPNGEQNGFNLLNTLTNDHENKARSRLAIQKSEKVNTIDHPPVRILTLHVPT